MGDGHPAPPCAVVIFGANGDLTKRKLIPALCNLAQGKLLPDAFAVVGVVREETTEEAFRARIAAGLKDVGAKVDGNAWAWLEPRLHVSWGELHDAETYRRLATKLGEVDAAHKTRGNATFYLSTPPSLIASIVEHLGAAGLAKEEGGRFRRIIVEKPFGTDLESARKLNAEIARTLGERQVYRIDHYLGKETVQNILVLRFGNGIFEPIWNRNYVNHVQITVAETLGVEGRGGYYEEAGALRDMVPNHLLQLMSLIGMEPPGSFEAESVRDEKAKLMRAIQPIAPEHVLTQAVRGQYRGYREEPKVSPRSNTETFVAMRLQVENWRWGGVPFYLRTGKSLAERRTEIVIQFKRAPFTLFAETDVERLSPNLLTISIQPKEGITLRFSAKVPGPAVRLADVDMDFNYAGFFGQKPSTGYETLLYDCMKGDPTLFQRADTVESGWSVVQPVLDVWHALSPRNFPNYAPGSWGPKEADELLAR
ncbi:MAG TPA: glucose-6-phosphate dehydrogenase, partial [Planctomycetota bacterium]|nr:glucose-6-phosphate dehydrogenase [Planctomycetota bacterium]